MRIPSISGNLWAVTPQLPIYRKQSFFGRYGVASIVTTCFIFRVIKLFAKTRLCSASYIVNGLKLTSLWQFRVHVRSGNVINANN